MARPKQRVVILTKDDIENLQKIVRARTAEARTVQRAKILLNSNEGMSDTAIAEKLDVNRRTINNVITKYHTAGVYAALVDLSGRGHPGIITDDEKAWIISVACQKPVEYGYAQELWTLQKLQFQISTRCEEAGYPGLKETAVSTIRKILNSAEAKSYWNGYYLERRDLEFKLNLNDELIVYMQIKIQFETEEDSGMAALSDDKKQAIQTISNTAPVVPPGLEHGYVGSDSEYKGHGAVSLLVGIDLHSGEVIPLVRNSHKSSDFIDFLKILDAKYVEELKIRIILDNHSAHNSKETMLYLKSRPGRFVFEFTPTYGSWPYLIESFFSKIAWAFLRGIRVKSKEELIERIYKYMDEVNAAPVVYRAKYKMDEITT